MRRVTFSEWDKENCESIRLNLHWSEIVPSLRVESWHTYILLLQRSVHTMNLACIISHSVEFNKYLQVNLVLKIVISMNKWLGRQKNFVIFCFTPEVLTLVAWVIIRRTEVLSSLILAVCGSRWYNVLSFVCFKLLYAKECIRGCAREWKTLELHYSLFIPFFYPQFMGELTELSNLYHTGTGGGVIISLLGH